MYKLIQEKKAKIAVPDAKKITSNRDEMPVFYNPLMKFNRDITMLLLNSVEDKAMHIADPLAGTGVRAVRMLKELDSGKIKNISINDMNEEAVRIIKKNLYLNKLEGKGKKINLYNTDANLFLLQGTGYDYIDIDPFGSPVPFLASAVLRLSRGGILGVTATDTAALAGASPEACKRKYDAKPLKNEMMHELGIRILIRKIQLVGAEHEKALVPIFSYFKDHYYRIFFRCEKGKLKVDEVLKQHKYFLYCKRCLDRKTHEFNHQKCRCSSQYEYAGPLFVGDLWDKKLVSKMLKRCDPEDKEGINGNDKSMHSFLSTISEEAERNIVGFYDITKLCKIADIDYVPKKLDFIKELKEKGFFASNTHFDGSAVRTDGLDRVKFF